MPRKRFSKRPPSDGVDTNDYDYDHGWSTLPDDEDSDAASAPKSKRKKRKPGQLIPYDGPDALEDTYAPETPAKRLVEWERDQARQQAYELRLRGYSFAAIAEKLDVSLKTASEYVETKAAEYRAKVEGFDPIAVASTTIAGLDAVKEKLLAEYMILAAGKDRIAALKAVATIEKDRVAILKETGLIKPAPQQVDLFIHTDIPPESRQLAARALIEATLTQELEAPTPPDVMDAVLVDDSALPTSADVGGELVVARPEDHE